MTDVFNIDVQKLETNCNKNLRVFVAKLNQHTSILRRNSTELNGIAGDLMTKSQLLLKLEKIKPDDLKCYTIVQRDKVHAEIVCQANSQTIAANRLVQELDRLQTELKNDYQNLLAAANALHILTTDTSVIVGNCKQKPITYYLDEACRILYAWKIYQMSLAMALQQIDMRKGDSMQQFKNVTITPQELSSSLDEYLLYSTFLFSPK